ncbi:MAG: hypothetical protein IJY80_03940 [Opitutales bacterium]|nr:hypothetical protein [Opitutales bacterium]
MSEKISIRFYNDCEVRNEGNSKWLFSATDAVAGVNGEQDHIKAVNYWRRLKRKFKPSTLGTFLMKVNWSKMWVFPKWKYPLNTKEVLATAEEISVVG